MGISPGKDSACLSVSGQRSKHRGSSLPVTTNSPIVHLLEVAPGTLPKYPSLSTMIEVGQLAILGSNAASAVLGFCLFGRRTQLPMTCWIKYAPGWMGGRGLGKQTAARLPRNSSPWQRRSAFKMHIKTGPRWMIQPFHLLFIKRLTSISYILI